MEKEYKEPEIVDDVFEKAEKIGEEKIEMLGEQVNSFKNVLIFKGITALILPISMFLLVIGVIGWLIMYVIDTHPYDYIVLGIFLFLIFSPIYKLLKMFKKK